MTSATARPVIALWHRYGLTPDDLHFDARRGGGRGNPSAYTLWYRKSPGEEIALSDDMALQVLAARMRAWMEARVGAIFSGPCHEGYRLSWTVCPTDPAKLPISYDVRRDSALAAFIDSIKVLHELGQHRERRHAE